MIVISTIQEVIDKERQTPAKIRNRHGIEVITDLYTAKKMVVANEAELIDDNYTVQETEEVTEPDYSTEVVTSNKDEVDAPVEPVVVISTPSKVKNENIVKKTK